MILVSFALGFVWSMIVSNMAAGKEWSLLKHITVLFGGCFALSFVEVAIQALVSGGVQ